MRKQTVFFIVIGFLMLGVYGCATTSSPSAQASKNSGLLEPAAMLRFSDVPVPLGFKSVPADSYSFETTGVRVGVLKYQGKADPDMVVKFYKEQMPMSGWNLLNVIEYGQRLLNFDKENETCVVTLSGKGNSVAITISLGPKAQNVPKKSKEPIK